MNFHGNDLESSNRKVIILTLDVGRLPGIKTKDSIRGLEEVIEESLKNSLWICCFFLAINMSRLVTIVPSLKLTACPRKSMVGSDDIIPFGAVSAYFQVRNCC